MWDDLGEREKLDLRSTDGIILYFLPIEAALNDLEFFNIPEILKEKLS